MTKLSDFYLMASLHKSSDCYLDILKKSYEIFKWKVKSSCFTGVDMHFWFVWESAVSHCPQMLAFMCFMKNSLSYSYHCSSAHNISVLCFWFLCCCCPFSEILILMFWHVFLSAWFLILVLLSFKIYSSQHNTCIGTKYY